MRGIVKWFNNEKGYGFICQEDGTDVFVHYSQINQEGYKSLETGDQVMYQLSKVDRGVQAHNVKKLIANNSQ